MTTARAMTATPRGLTGTPDPTGAAVLRDPFGVVPQVLDLVRLTGAIFFWAGPGPTALARSVHASPR